jgi:nucleotide-binding universal stress UspA family protein
MRRYLVVANQTLSSDELVEVLRERAAAEPSEFWIVVPATPVKHLAAKAVPVPPMPVMGGVLALPGTREEARRLAEEKLQAALQRLAAAATQADGEVGDGDPMRAVEAVLSRRQFDEIIVSTLPERLSHWLRQDFPSRLEHRFDLPVTHVEATALPNL